MDSSTNSSTRAKHETFDETIIFNPVDKMNSAGTIDVPESGLDYQIFPIPDEFGEASYGTIQITEANVSITLRPRSVMKLAKNKDIWVATVNGVVKGRLSSCPYILKMPGWASYQEVWVVNLERNICECSLFCGWTKANYLMFYSARRLWGLGCGSRRTIMRPHHCKPLNGVARIYFASLQNLCRYKK